MYFLKIFVLFAELLVNTFSNAIFYKIKRPVLDLAESATFKPRVAIEKVFNILFMEWMIIVAIILAMNHRGCAIILIKLSAFGIIYYCSELERIGVLQKTPVVIQLIVYIISALGLITLSLPLCRIFAYFDAQQRQQQQQEAEERQGEEGEEQGEEREESETDHNSGLWTEEENQEQPQNSALDQMYRDLEEMEEQRLQQQLQNEAVIRAHMFAWFLRIEAEQRRQRPGEPTLLYRLYESLRSHFNRQSNDSEDDEGEQSDENVNLEYELLNIYKYLDEYFSFMEQQRRQQQQNEESESENDEN